MNLLVIFSANNVNTQHAQSFANAVKSNNSKLKFPEREQAIVLDAIEGTQKIDYYILGVGKLIGPQNIIFASRVSNNRVCLYLSSKELVDSFINTHEGININE